MGGFVQLVRGGVCIGLSVMCLICLVISLTGQGILEKDVEAESIAAEHRLTALETKMDLQAAEIHDVRQTQWLILLALAGLTGETGIRVLKKR